MASPEEDLVLNEGDGKIFVVYNTSTTVTPAYAATLVLVFGLGWIALIAAVYYYLIFGTNKYSESYSNSYSQRRSKSMSSMDCFTRSWILLLLQPFQVGSWEVGKKETLQKRKRTNWLELSNIWTNSKRGIQIRGLKKVFIDHNMPYHTAHNNHHLKYKSCK